MTAAGTTLDEVRRIGRTLMKIVVASTILRVVAMAVSRALERSADTASGDFRLAAIWEIRNLECRAPIFRAGRATAVLGGIDIDLRDTTPDPAGGELSLRAVLGGIRVIVPETWRVDVSVDTVAGQVEVRTPPPVDLPEDGPRVDIEAVVRMGGVLITTDD